jgi:hypothetical protein
MSMRAHRAHSRDIAQKKFGARARAEGTEETIEGIAQ